MILFPIQPSVAFLKETPNKIHKHARHPTVHAYLKSGKGVKKWQASSMFSDQILQSADDGTNYKLVIDTYLYKA